MPNDLHFRSTPMTTSTDVTGPTEGLRVRGGLESAWQAGTHFSRYEIDSKLASGGMAEVWRAKLKGVRGFEKRIVIKTMLPQLAGRPDLVEIFINEATLASAFSHPNIAHVFDFGQLEGRYFIAMEYVPGVTLRFAHKRMLARGETLPMAATLHVMIDVCDALQAVHELADANGALGLVHRDLSPDNVIVSTSGAAKLIDFGAARATARTPLPSTFVGKYRYAAPERVRRSDEDHRSDLYSAGVILYECLTGLRPYDGPDAEVIRAALEARVHDPREHAPSLPAPIAEMVMRAMAPEPADRFATGREMREALTRCLIALGASTKERDVSASLAALMEAPDSVPVLIAPREAVPEAVDIAADPSSGVDVALCEVEIIEASGPIRADAPPPVPAMPARARAVVTPPMPPIPETRPVDSTAPSAPHWSLPGQLFERVFGGPSSAAPGLLGWRRTPEQPPHDSHRSALQRAVELFDRGIELRRAGRYGEALDAWERAAVLAPENRVYQSNVARLRQQLDELRVAERRLAEWSGGFDAGDD
jgi:eukaryotic-like serine/threonine-protein kinase